METDYLLYEMDYNQQKEKIEARMETNIEWCDSKQRGDDCCREVIAKKDHRTGLFNYTDDGVLRSLQPWEYEIRHIFLQIFLR